MARKSSGGFGFAVLGFCEAENAQCLLQKKKDCQELPELVVAKFVWCIIVPKISVLFAKLGSGKNKSCETVFFGVCG